jgi:hypothetical protein
MTDPSATEGRYLPCDKVSTALVVPGIPSVPGWQSGPDAIAVERSQQHDGSFHVSTELPTLDEYAAADIHAVQAWPKGEVITPAARSPNRREGQGKGADPFTPVGHPGFLATLCGPVDGKHSVRGESLCASYMVLKVQRAATVDLASATGAPAWRACVGHAAQLGAARIFGSTRLFTLGDMPIFLRQEGLLDPPDLRSNGRWKEYLGVLGFEHPWDLTPLCKKEAAHELGMRHTHS